MDTPSNPLYDSETVDSIVDAIKSKINSSISSHNNSDDVHPNLFDSIKNGIQVVDNKLAVGKYYLEDITDTDNLTNNWENHLNITYDETYNNAPSIKAVSALGNYIFQEYESFICSFNISIINNDHFLLVVESNKFLNIVASEEKKVDDDKHINYVSENEVNVRFIVIGDSTSIFVDNKLIFSTDNRIPYLYVDGSWYMYDLKILYDFKYIDIFSNYYNKSEVDTLISSLESRIASLENEIEDLEEDLNS